MEASSQQTRQVRLVLMLVLGIAAAAACAVTLMLWKAPAASGQDETSPTEPSFLVKCGFSHRKRVDPIVDPGPPGTMSHHMHDFFGNTTTDANSTYETLRAGGTTCDDPQDTAA
jgi:flagellar basal body-associated protein FliL